LDGDLQSDECCACGGVVPPMIELMAEQEAPVET